MEAAQISAKMAAAIVQHSGYTPVSADLGGRTLIEVLEPFAELLSALLAEREMRPEFDALEEPGLAAAVERTDAALESGWMTE